MRIEPGHLRRQLPDLPGVYLFKDPGARPIYVGKAKNLKKRVLSYFRSASEIPDKTSIMLERAASLDFIVTSTEQEAFILESNLIKRHMPRYNVVLRDDKRYPCLRLSINEPYPRLSIVRKIKKDGSLYLGPFSSAYAVRNTVKLVDRVFQLRKCKGGRLPKMSRPCLNYQMGRCLGPCANDVPLSQYREIVRQVRLFLEGRNRELIAGLKRDMEDASRSMDFEKAAQLRDQIRSIERVVERQHVVSKRLEDLDIIGIRQKGQLNQVVVLFVRKGQLLGSRNFLFREKEAEKGEILEAFVKQFYRADSFIPGKILLSEKIEDLDSIKGYLSRVASKRVEITVPLRGEKLNIMKMALVNAEEVLAGHEDEKMIDLMDSVGSVLRLKSRPRTIEGFDISNLYGGMAVGTVVSFAEGLPHKAGYRNYRIRGVEGIDDYAMMKELVERRLSRGPLPDLFLIDGGKGHLATVKRVLDTVADREPPQVISIAKADKEKEGSTDRIFLPGRKNPVRLAADHPVLLLMMRIRDEAHRRAISYHRRLMQKQLAESDLDRIPGIGKKRKRILLNYFKDINAISHAGLDELIKVPGISRGMAEGILGYLSGQGKIDRVDTR